MIAYRTVIESTKENTPSYSKIRVRYDHINDSGAPVPPNSPCTSNTSVNSEMKTANSNNNKHNANITSMKSSSTVNTFNNSNKAFTTTTTSQSPPQQSLSQPLTIPMKLFNNITANVLPSYPLITNNTLYKYNSHDIHHHSMNVLNIDKSNFIGEVMEPFWIMKDSTCNTTNNNTTNNTNINTHYWKEPDEYFMHDLVKTHISNQDMIKFWDILHVVIDLPIYCNLCICPYFHNKYEIINLLKKPEHKIFWMNGNASILPKDIASELINHSYVIHS